LTGTTTYYVSASGCAGALRVPVTATIHPASVGGTLNGSVTVVSASNSSTLTLTGHTGRIVKWQSSIDNFGIDITDIAHTADQLTVNGLTQTTQYRAVVQSGSCGPVFSNAATITVSGVLPLQTASLRVSKQGTAALVQWKAFQQDQTSHFEVEKSGNGLDFIKAKTVLSTGANTETSYQWVDVQPLKGTSFYRVKEVLKTGVSQYSNIGRLSFENGHSGVSIIPNPITDGKVSLQFYGMEAGKYVVRMINSAGMVISETNLTTNGNSNHLFLLPGRVNSGVYQLSIANWKGSTTHTSVLVH
ncbi:MAG TPA: T9SS type A sorting domain-containing protein, partial [Flavisolibacter sp.]|nr:T9SS type A sorting domain-containing protein [Flavisolibacter sp.]